MRFKKISMVAILIAVFGCMTAFSGIQIKNLPSLSQNTNSLFEKREKPVEIHYHPFDSSDCKNYLSDNVKKRGYQPIQLTIENKSSHTYKLASDQVSLETATGSDIAWKATRSQIPQSVLLKVGSFFFPPLTIASTVDGVVGFQNHMKIRKDLNAKSLKADGEEILPYSTVQRLIFVPEESLEDAFSIELYDLDTDLPVSFYSELEIEKT